MHDHVRRERAQQRHREDVLAAGLDAVGAVTDRLAAQQSRAQVAQVAHAGLTGRTRPAGRDERQHDVVADGEVLHAGADLGDDARALVAAEDREARHRDATGNQMVIRMAHPGRFHLDLDFILGRVTDLDFLDGPRLVEIPDQRAFCLHEDLPCIR